ncbi:Crp/Fnr family transcriptional regulator [Leptospira gomenensis]|uniref:Crp/Fnr family transcriptional regulator n=1 Tax=Leptospira gomenensis TaxID=2484974 RepID=A0A5F1YEV2_9LEPT|nr:Crp/Fnr family transcriptional regulator [Leptospira gomenensis]TGK32606.1 Crp/Fnr family transcriptional regulator [Leptospira gomenensis]TGK38336.1 Crp/Fnr family transcriptional regulator [Leptospira gomenensis]TGK52150.1 Crp/Fnr family transcriptional regulator [Leptospira gomenensis]TGK62996.1 Crp/Fnr family transcriptional regulator [Leptospira gomenensis]
MTALKKTIAPISKTTRTEQKEPLRLVPSSGLPFQDKKNGFYQKGQILFQEGETSPGFYVVVKGSVRSYRASKTADKQQTFRIHYEGSWVGLRDSIGGGTYLHNAVALEDTEVQFVSESEFRLLLQTDSEFRNLAFDKMATESREAENKIYSMGTRHVHAQVSEYLLERMREEGSEIELPFTREVMASIIGVTTETLVRTLSDLKCRGWIEIDKKRISVRDPDSLARLLD